MIARVGDGEIWSQVDHERKMTLSLPNYNKLCLSDSLLGYQSDESYKVGDRYSSTFRDIVCPLTVNDK